MRKVRMLTPVLLGVVVVVGCGGKDKDGEVEFDRSTGTFKGRGPDGAEFEGGPRVDIPEDFPKDVPVYQGATPVMAMKQKGNFTLALTTTDAVAKVLDTYKKKLKADGWVEESVMSMGPQTQVYYSKDTRKVAVIVAGDDGQTTIHISVMASE